jgi:hypothetical protein
VRARKSLSLRMVWGFFFGSKCAISQIVMNRSARAACFDTAGVQSITTAFDDALRELRLDRADPKAEILPPWKRQPNDSVRAS